MGTFEIDLLGTSEASMGRSVNLIIFADSA